MPDAFQEVEDGRVFEAVEIGSDIILLAGPLEKERWAQSASSLGGQENFSRFGKLI